MLNINEILKILPQRFPFILIDRVVEIDPGKKAVAIKNVTYDEGFFPGHFPDNPVMPGVLIVEAMAQAAIIFFHAKDSAAHVPRAAYFLGSIKSRFLHPVVPGDQLVLTVEPVRLFAKAGILKVVARVLDREVATAELSLFAK